MTKTPAVRWPAPLAVLCLILAGCDGSSSKSASPATSSTGTSASSSATPSASSSAGSATASSSSPAPGFASTSAGTPKGVLSKPDFLIEMNALCASFGTRVKALPTPTAATDFDAITANLTATLRLGPSFISQAEALVNRSAERAILQKNWLSVEKADFAAFKPVAQRMIVHSKARDAAKVQADANALSAVPNHSRTLAAYLAGFGLSSCAELKSL
ncbi:MAG TPA: hypothetical protein VF612_17025 [Jatrophihabitans sp.]|uniref:hypothetical protein n=1 Tax=Jatrophihabitans sp. TaxID=1932789 RepID=UPI002EEA0A2A